MDEWSDSDSGFSDSCSFQSDETERRSPATSESSATRSSPAISKSSGISECSWINVPDIEPYSCANLERIQKFENDDENEEGGFDLIIEKIVVNPTSKHKEIQNWVNSSLEVSDSPEENKAQLPELLEEVVAATDEKPTKQQDSCPEKFFKWMGSLSTSSTKSRGSSIASLSCIDDGVGYSPGMSSFFNDDATSPSQIQETKRSLPTPASFQLSLSTGAPKQLDSSHLEDKHNLDNVNSQSLKKSCGSSNESIDADTILHNFHNKRSTIDDISSRSLVVETFGSSEQSSDTPIECSNNKREQIQKCTITPSPGLKQTQECLKEIINFSPKNLHFVQPSHNVEVNYCFQEIPSRPQSQEENVTSVSSDHTPVTETTREESRPLKPQPGNEMEDSPQKQATPGSQKDLTQTSSQQEVPEKNDQLEFSSVSPIFGKSAVDELADHVQPEPGPADITIQQIRCQATCVENIRATNAIDETIANDDENQIDTDPSPSIRTHNMRIVDEPKSTKSRKVRPKTGKLSASRKEDDIPHENNARKLSGVNRQKDQTNSVNVEENISQKFAKLESSPEQESKKLLDLLQVQKVTKDLTKTKKIEKDNANKSKENRSGKSKKITASPRVDKVNKPQGDKGDKKHVSFSNSFVKSYSPEPRVHFPLPKRLPLPSIPPNDNKIKPVIKKSKASLKSDIAPLPAISTGKKSSVSVVKKTETSRKYVDMLPIRDVTKRSLSPVFVKKQPTSKQLPSKPLLPPMKNNRRTAIQTYETPPPKRISLRDARIQNNENSSLSPVFVEKQPTQKQLPSKPVIQTYDTSPPKRISLRSARIQKNENRKSLITLEVKAQRVNPHAQWYQQPIKIKRNNINMQRVENNASKLKTTLPLGTRPPTGLLIPRPPTGTLGPRAPTAPLVPRPPSKPKREEKGVRPHPFRGRTSRK